MSEPDTRWLPFDFGDPGAVADWDAIDDRVMGGVSSSRLRHDPAGHAVFEGNVLLERNGGFASIRSTPADRGRPGAQTCFIETRATGKDAPRRPRRQTRARAPAARRAPPRTRGHDLHDT